MFRQSWILRVFIATLLTACVSDDPSAPLFEGTTVEIVGAPSDSVLLADGEIQLNAIVRSVDGTEITGVRPTWTSTDASLATVSSDGRVAGVRPGEVNVRVNAAGAIDQRALSVRTRVPLPPGGGPALVSTLLDGDVRITLGAGAVPDGTVLHVRAVDDPPPLARLVSGSAIELGPPGLTFAAPVTLALSYPSTIALADQPHLRLYRLSGGAWSLASGGSVDVDARRALGAISRTGTYALLQRAGVAALRIDAGDAQRALVGMFVGIAPRVMVRDADDRPVEGTVVRFFVSSGGGTLVGEANAVSDAEGRATLPGQWRLGPTNGINTLTAEIVGSSVVPVTFTATGEALTLVLTRDIAGAVSGKPATTQPRLEFRTSGGAILPISDGVTAELLNGNGTLAGTLRVDAINGVVTFTNLRIDGTGAHQLRFTSGGHRPSGSVFTVTQELATLTVLVQPAGAEEDEAFTTQPVIQLLDDAGLPYLPDKAVTASIASGPGDLRGERTVVSSGGRATFTNLRINSDGLHRLRFETTSPTRSVLSVQFRVEED